MQIIKLYKGNGKSLSPIKEAGMTEAMFTRIVADNGMGITDGVIVATCIDVITSTVSDWTDCAAPPEPVAPETQELADVVNDAYNMANDLIGE